MLSFPSSLRIFAATEAVDFRKSHDGLYAHVRQHFSADPFDGSVFVFFNRRRDRIKLLVWDRNGFWLFYKRLERGTFRALAKRGAKRVEMTRAELAMILEGIDLERGRMRKHFADEIRLSKRHGDVDTHQRSEAARARERSAAYRES